MTTGISAYQFRPKLTRKSSPIIVRAMYTLNGVITSFGRFEEVTSYLLFMAALLTSSVSHAVLFFCFCFRSRSSKRLSAFKRWSTSHLYVISNSIYSPPAETSSSDSPLAANFNSSLFPSFSTFRSLMVMIILVLEIFCRWRFLRPFLREYNGRIL